MPIPSVTYTFSDGTTAYGSEVQQDFADLVAALTDGTKDLTINSLTTTGLVSIGGAVTLGNAAADVITWNGTASSILLDNAATNGGRIYFNGGATSYINSSADGTDLSLAGFTNITLTAAGALALEAGISGTTITGSSYVTGTYFLPTADDTSAPGANYLYKANVPKAWANISIDAASPAVINNDHNISSATWSADSLTIGLDTDMADVSYAVSVCCDAISSIICVDLKSVAAGSFIINGYVLATAANRNWVNGDNVHVMIMGDQ